MEQPASPTPASATLTTAPPAQPTPDPAAVPLAGVAGLSRDQTTALGWIAEDEAAGKMTKEQAQQARREVTGLDPDQFVADTRTPEQIQFDADFAAAKPQDITLPRYENDHLTPEQKKVDGWARNTLSTGRFPVGPANFIAKEANRWVSETEHWSDSQHELYARSETLRLQNLWGEHYQERIAMAQEFVREWDKKCPGLVDFLNRTGLGNNSLIATQIYMNAERLARRNGSKK